MECHGEFVNRRAFLATASGGAAALVAACTDVTAPDARFPAARLSSRRRNPYATPEAGLSQLQLRDSFTARNGLLYLPANYSVKVQSPLIVALHGAGGSGYSWTSPAWLALLDEFNTVMIAPDSRSFATWDLVDKGNYGADVAFIDNAMAEVFRQINVDASRIALVGFSDGATEAIGLGLLNGDLFNGVVGFSPGYFYAPFARGHTHAFISHGTTDTVLSYFKSRDSIVPEIQALGVPVQFSSFVGGHTIPLDVGRAGLYYALAVK